MKKYQIVIFVLLLLIGRQTAAESVFVAIENFSVNQISADGNFAVGQTLDDPNEASLWSIEGGIERLDNLTGGTVRSDGVGISADGYTVVGYIRLPTSGSYYRDEPFRWTQERGMEKMYDLSGGAIAGGFAKDASADGSVIIGMSSGSTWRWSEGEAPLFISDARPTALSNNGNAMVGQYNSEAFRWTVTNGIEGLGFLADDGWWSSAGGISGDGKVVVGDSDSNYSGEAFRWDSTKQMVGLGFLRANNYFSSGANDASHDGSVIVGASLAVLPNNRVVNEAFVWDENHGMRYFQGILEQYFNLDLSGWQLKWIYGVSDDGLSFVGHGDWNSEGLSWYAKIDTPLTDIDFIPELPQFPINLPHESPYVIKKICDTDTDIPEGFGKFKSLWGSAISQGRIIFSGNGSDNQRGLYIANGRTGIIEVIVNQDSTLPSYGFRGFDRRSVEKENIAYSAWLTDSVSGQSIESILVHTPTGGNVVIIDGSTPIPEGTGNFTRFTGPGYAGIDAFGNSLVFKGGGLDGQEGIYISDLNGANIKRIADKNTLIPGNLNKFSYFIYSNAEDGGVAFRGRDATTGDGIYYFDLTTEALRAVVDNNTMATDLNENLDDFASPSLSGKQIAFSSGNQGVYVADVNKSALTKIADINTAVPDGLGTFTSFGDLAMDNNKVAFSGRSFYGSGLYVGDGQNLFAIISDLDTLDGKTIRSIGIDSYKARDNFDSNQIVFSIRFTDGSYGIYVAIPKIVVAIDEILDFYDESVANGTIECNGNCKSPYTQLSKVRDKIVKAKKIIEREKFKTALNKLNNIYDKCDGEPKPKDPITGSAVSILNDMISNLMDELACTHS
ncbi:hypothetical protein D3OALGA1CA_652 [Olavius algarvensis associated proteobacterium Delta 3]|nr:hypothetical protein D3OALGA1CA_652 [Olavius algarvensis associated proteobacterium Delta 3]CAB5128329.1 hypothetical protein D3OALGB2SA_3438 [Olavius algarvensis associated proteobacterium Delta 3]